MTCESCSADCWTVRPRSAKRYVDAGAETIFVRVPRCNSRDIEHGVVYLKLAEQIAAGANAFSAGTRFFDVLGAFLSNRVLAQRFDGEPLSIAGSF